MPVVRLAVLPRHHAHHCVALHLRLEVAADTAIGAGSDHRMLWLTQLNDRLLEQRSGRAGLHAGTARYALAGQERLACASGNLRGETATFDGQREGALRLLACAHTARADDAARRIELEVGVGSVDLGMQMIGAVLAVAHFAHPDRAGHLLEFIVAGDRGGEAVKRMVGQVQLHHATAQRGARARWWWIPSCQVRPAWCRTPAFRRGPRFPQTDPAGAERFQHVGGAEFRNADAGIHRRAHDRSAGRHRDLLPVDRQRHLLGGTGFPVCRSRFPESAACVPRSIQCQADRCHSAASRCAGRKSSGKCSSALITGYGMNPPSAHSEPNFIVWQRSRSRSRFASTSRRR